MRFFLLFLVGRHQPFLHTTRPKEQYLRPDCPKSASQASSTIHGAIASCNPAFRFDPIAVYGMEAYVEGSLQSCQTTEDGSAEDTMFTNCMRKNITTQFIYTGDVDGSQRYHQGPVYHPVKYRIFRTSLERIDRLPRNITGMPEGVNQILYGVGSVSNSSITFHKHYNPDELRRLELLLDKNVTQECLPY